MKKLNELNIGDIIYLYGIGSIANGEFVVDKKVEIIKVNSHFNVVTGKEIPQIMNPINHIIKANEGVVYRNLVWLSEDNKEMAMKLLVDFFERKIQIAQNSIDGFINKQKMITDRFCTENRQNEMFE